MIVYHGTTTWKMHSLFSGNFESRFPGLFVTDVMERAARYANSQASQVVTEQAFPLTGCAVVVAIEVEDAPKWMRRPESHHTLDKCEAIIQCGRIVEMWVGKPGHLSFREHSNVTRAQEQLTDIPIHVEG